jgi:CheY-like chemotaxis protein
VLVIEDHDDARYVLTKYLEHYDARVMGAHSAAEAREVLRHATPDIILTDVHMPRESGIDFLRWVRTSAPTHLNNIPVVGLSASSQYTLPQAAHAFTAWFGKPTNYDEVCSIVAALFHRTRR